MPETGEDQAPEIVTPINDESYMTDSSESGWQSSDGEEGYVDSDEEHEMLAKWDDYRDD